MPTIKIEKLINSHSSQVFLYFTNSTALRDWFCDGATADPHVGGRLYCWWNGGYYTSGEYLQLTQDEFISFIWLGRGEPHATIVDVKLIKRKAGTLLRLAHRKLGRSSKWIAISTEYEKEWTKALNNLASVLENGEDLRITSRPMLGIFTDEFNDIIAKKLGVPIGQGLRISGVVEGLGAQKAGLIANDIIIGLDGQEITGAATFGAYIGNKTACDIIEVTFYRCAEKKTTSMTLSGRPIPPIPRTGLELSKQVEPVYKQYEGEIKSLLNGASEEDCIRKPSPMEWSANEVLAHLIHSELGWQNIVSEIIGGHEGLYDNWGGNIQAHIDGTVATFSTKTELLKELKTHDAETLSMLAHIPAEFLSRKGKYWKLVYQAHQIPNHLQTHLDQIKGAIQASRSR